jgi:Tripartite tricarboxylate transporter TctB family
MTPIRVAAVLAVICLVSAWQLTAIGTSAIQMAVDAKAVPTVVVALLAVLTVMYGISAWRGQQADESLEPDQAALPGSGARLVSLLAGGVAFMAGLPWLGFILPATVCGMCVARSFDAALGAKSAMICGIISGCFWLLFAKVLGVGLGPATPFGF